MVTEACSLRWTQDGSTVACNQGNRETLRAEPGGRGSGFRQREGVGGVALVGRGAEGSKGNLLNPQTLARDSESLGGYNSSVKHLLGTAWSPAQDHREKA